MATQWALKPSLKSLFCALRSQLVVMSSAPTVAVLSACIRASSNPIAVRVEGHAAPQLDTTARRFRYLLVCTPEIMQK